MLTDAQFSKSLLPIHQREITVPRSQVLGIVSVDQVVRRMEVNGRQLERDVCHLYTNVSLPAGWYILSQIQRSGYTGPRSEMPVIKASGIYSAGDTHEVGHRITTHSGAVGLRASGKKVEFIQRLRIVEPIGFEITGHSIFICENKEGVIMRVRDEFKLLVR